jgi:TolB-like protein/DNA-binding winged helix-turn-helix (wHTH) protein
MHALRSGRVRVGAFELDLTTGELQSSETPDPNHKIILREQVFQVLRMLAERGCKIVTREEIKSKLWGNDTVVDFDQSINATIKALRRALGDSADNPRYVETLGRRGYRLMLPIEYLESAPATAVEKDREPREQSAVEMSGNATRVQRPTRSQWWEAAFVLVSAVILAGAGYLSWRHSRPTPLPGKVMLAVLPFENLTGDPNKEYLADGLTEETISQLGRLNPEQLGVIARTSVMGYKHKDERLDQVGRDLSVQYVMENSFRESGDHLRITVQLLQVKDQSHLWTKDFDYPARNILNVEDDVAKAVASEIQLRLTPQQQAALSRSHPVNPEAFDAYLQGYYFFQRNADKDTDMSARYFERAIQLDPGYALAWAWLSRARNWQAEVGLIPREEGSRASRDAIERALALDPSLPEANSQMARLKVYVDFDWVGADDFIQRALARDPGNPVYLAQAAWSAAIFARSDEALAIARRGVEVDPLNAYSRSGLANIEFLEGHLARAEADAKRSLELSPDVWPGPLLLSQIYLMEGRPRDALPEVKKVQIESQRISLYAVTYAALGRKKQSDAALKELIAKYNSHSAYLVAAVYAFRNQPDEAFEWLYRAYAQREGSVAETNLDPLLKNLHSDPRYAAFLKKIHQPALP